VPLLVIWLAHAIWAALPASTHGLLYLVGDSRHADQRGPKHPVAQQGRQSQHYPWFFGMRFVRLRAAWDGYRVLVGFRIILPKHHTAYRNENVVFREMVGEFVPKGWAKLVMVGGVHLLKALGDRAGELGAQVGTGSGRAPSQWGQGPQ